MRKVGFFVVVVLAFSQNLYASTPEYFNKVVDKIYIIEGGKKAKVPYGILSVKTNNPRKVCYNTVRNNYKRWLKAGRPGTYLQFLASRYAPIGVSNDPRNLNSNWYRNLSFYMGEK